MWSATSTCKTRLFWAKYDPLHQPNQCSALLENWHTGSRTVSGAAHQASWPGATPFEDYIRPREATQHYCSSTCFQATPSNRPGVVRMRHKIGQHTDEKVLYMPGEFRALPLLRLATAAMQSDAVSHVSDPQRTVGHVWGGRPTLD